MPDSFRNNSDSVDAPARRVAMVAPSDTSNFAEVVKGLYIGSGGDLVLVAADAPAGAAGVMFRNLPSGALLPVRARRVAATGTSAADLVALL